MAVIDVLMLSGEHFRAERFKEFSDTDISVALTSIIQILVLCDTNRLSLKSDVIQDLQYARNRAIVILAKRCSLSIP